MDRVEYQTMPRGTFVGYVSRDGQPTGGVITYVDESDVFPRYYAGTLKDGAPNGMGREECLRDSYVGSFAHGKRHGIGYVTGNGTSALWEFRDGVPLKELEKTRERFDELEIANYKAVICAASLYTATMESLGIETLDDKIHSSHAHVCSFVPRAKVLKRVFGNTMMHDKVADFFGEYETSTLEAVDLGIVLSFLEENMQRNLSTCRELVRLIITDCVKNSIIPIPQSVYDSAVEEVASEEAAAPIEEAASEEVAAPIEEVASEEAASEEVAVPAVPVNRKTRAVSPPPELASTGVQLSGIHKKVYTATKKIVGTRFHSTKILRRTRRLLDGLLTDANVGEWMFANLHRLCPDTRSLIKMVVG